MKRIILLLLACLLFAAPVKADILGTDDAAVLLAATPLIDNILNAMKQDDYNAFIRDFSPDMKAAMTKDKFREGQDRMRTSAGNLVSKKYLGFLNRDNLTVALWKATFDKNSSEVLIRLSVDKQKEGNLLVAGLWFQ